MCIRDRFGSDLDEATKSQIERGQRLTELLKQPQYQPMSVWEQAASVFTVSEGLFDEVPSSKIKDAQKALLTRLWTDHKKDMQELTKGTDKLESSSDMGGLIAKTAKMVAKGFED